MNTVEERLYDLHGYDVDPNRTLDGVRIRHDDTIAGFFEVPSSRVEQGRNP